MLEINEKFKHLLPDLSQAEFRELELSLKEEGCRTPIQVWNNQIVDGHNRHEICQKYNLPYEIEELSFTDEDSACMWILQNQLGRRNLNDNQRILYIGELYKLRKRAVGAPVGNTNALEKNMDSDIGSKDKNNVVIVTTLNSGTPKRTAQVIAEEFNMGEKTVRRAEKIVDAFDQVDETTKSEFQRGEIKQKDLIKKVKASASSNEQPPAEKKKFEDGKNEATKVMKSQSLRLQEILQKSKDKYTEIKKKGISEPYPLPLTNLYSALEEFYRKMENSSAILENLFFCEACLNDGCDHCDNTGYVNEIQRHYQLQQIKINPAWRGKFVKEVDEERDKIIEEIFGKA